MDNTFFYLKCTSSIFLKNNLKLGDSTTKVCTMH